MRDKLFNLTKEEIQDKLFNSLDLYPDYFTKTPTEMANELESNYPIGLASYLSGQATANSARGFKSIDVKLTDPNKFSILNDKIELEFDTNDGDVSESNIEYWKNVSLIIYERRWILKN